MSVPAPRRWWRRRRAEARGLAVLAEAGATIVVAVDGLVPSWTCRAVADVLDAWGRLEPRARADADAAARAAGEAAGVRVVRELRSLFAQDPAAQRSTPLEVIRGLRREPTALLHRLGVPPVVREPFDEAAFPDDRYGLVPRTALDLGDEALGAALLAWGAAKAAVLGSRASHGLL